MRFFWSTERCAAFQSPVDDAYDSMVQEYRYSALGYFLLLMYTLRRMYNTFFAILLSLYYKTVFAILLSLYYNTVFALLLSLYCT